MIDYACFNSFLLSLEFLDIFFRMCMLSEAIERRKIKNFVEFGANPEIASKFRYFHINPKRQEKWHVGGTQKSENFKIDQNVFKQQ